VNAVPVALLAAPGDWDELYRLYGDDVRAVVRRRLPWARPWDQDDIVQHIFQQFRKNDVIGQYDPGYVSERTGGAVSFRSFLLAKVPLYCRGLSQRLSKISARELLIADAPGPDGVTPWIEHVADEPWPGFGDLADSEVLARIREKLASRPSPAGQPGLLALFDDLAARAGDGQPVTGRFLARKYQVPEHEGAGYLARLREELRVAASGDFRVARVGGIEAGGLWLSPDQLRAAAKALRDSPGNQVVRVWERAGHPLAASGQKWYLAPAKRELGLFPHLRPAKGGHYAGGHPSPVKAGLIHWLERIADGIAEDAVVPEPAWAALAAAAGALDGASPEFVADLLAVAQAMLGGE
jgi:hypothetical protein